MMSVTDVIISPGAVIIFTSHDKMISVQYIIYDIYHTSYIHIYNILLLLSHYLRHKSYDWVGVQCNR